MKEKKKMKTKYIIPDISIIKLDIEISLTMESNPIEGPGETFNNTLQLKDDPYKTNVG